MPVEPGVIDSNVLVYAINPDSPQHGAFHTLLETVRGASVILYVTSQILCEFYAVITHRKRVAVPTTPADAVLIIADLLAQPGLHVLPTTKQAASRLIKLLQSRPVIGSDVFDLQIAATMQANDICRIYTFNTANFSEVPRVNGDHSWTNVTAQAREAAID